MVDNKFMQEQLNDLQIIAAKQASQIERVVKDVTIIENTIEALHIRLGLLTLLISLNNKL